MSMFMSHEELIELTGYKLASKQAEMLKRQRIPFHTNKCGHPKVAKATLEGRKAEEKKTETWSPSWAAKAL
jgi:hypothetical protein